MTRRPGMSLAEVLVALFLMALGTISILTLFPLGAVQMGQALKDDRTAQSAQQADALMRVYWKLNVVENSAEPLLGAFLDPSGSGFPPAPPFPVFASPQLNLLPVSGGMGLAYPVVVDPMGFVARGGAPAGSQVWVVNQNQVSATSILGTNLARRSLQVMLSSPNPGSQAFRTCSLMDGLGYDASGLANVTVAPDTVDRELRYNWLWVLQPDTTNLRAPNMTVVVFDKRASLFAPPGAEQVFAASPLNFGCTPGQTVVSFPAGNAPPVQKGGWLMDATVANLDIKNVPYVPPNAPPNPPTGPPPAAQPFSYIRNANFYRVVSVTNNGTTVDVEFQTPLQPDSVTPSAPFVLLPPSMRQFVLLTGVSEVFQRPPLSTAP